MKAAWSHFFKMPTKVLSLLLSSGTFSPMAAPGPGVEALDDCSEAGAERPEDDEAIILCNVWVHKAVERDTKCFGMRVSVKDVNPNLNYRGA